MSDPVAARGFGWIWLAIEVGWQISGPALRKAQQAFVLEIEVDQGEAAAQPVMVLGDAAVAHHIEAEDALQDAERRGARHQQCKDYFAEESLQLRVRV